jgi:hypothetical protein
MTPEGAAKETDTMTETITERTEDWTRCLCGNEPRLDGFVCTNGAGNSAEGKYGPTAEWDGDTMACLTCGRVFGLVTGIVSTTVDAEHLRDAIEQAQAR